MSAQQTVNLPYPSNSISASTITTTNTTSSGNISIGNGYIQTGQLYYNNTPVALQHDKPSVSRLNDILKDSISREIILCKDKEECKVKYGEYGLKLYESLVGEVIQEAIKSEEAFLVRLQQEHDKIEKLKEFIREHVDKETALKVLADLLSHN